MANMRVFKFNVSLIVERVTLSINFPCKLQVQWKRGKQKVETNPADLNVGVCNINQSLELQTNVYFEDQKFLEKKSSFTILIMTTKGNKVGGQASLELSQYLNRKQDSISEAIRLDKCPDKNAKLYIKLNFSLIQEIDIDTLSRVSMVSKGDDSFEGEETTNQLHSEMLRVQQKDNQISQLQREIANKTEEINDVTQANVNLKQKFYETLDKLQNFEEKSEKLEREQAQLLKQNKQLEQQNLEQSYQFTEMNEKIKNLNLEIKRYQQQLNKQQQETQQLQETIKSSDSEQKTNSLINDYEKELYIYKNKVNDLEKKLSKEQQQHEQDYVLYQLKLKNLQSQLVDKQEQLPNQEQQQLKNQLLSQQQKEEQFNKILSQYKEQLSKSIASEKKLKLQHQQDLDSLSEKVIQLKCQIGDMFNAAQEFGGNILVDRLQFAVGLSE